MWRSARLRGTRPSRSAARSSSSAAWTCGRSVDACKSWSLASSRFKRSAPWRRRNANSLRRFVLKVHWTFPLAACPCYPSTWRLSRGRFSGPVRHAALMADRWPGLRTTVIEVLVQGEHAAKEIVRGLAVNRSLSPSRGGKPAWPTAGGRRHRGARRWLTRGPLGVQSGAGRSGHPRQYRPHHLGGGS